MNKSQTESTTFKDSNFDFLILGAGFAGLTLAIELSKRGSSVCIMDVASPGAGASGSPGGLMNPATSQKALMPQDAKKCVDAFNSMMEFVLDGQDSEVTLSHKVLRPAVDEKLKTNFLRSLETEKWPSNWIEWLDEEQISKMVEFQNFGGLLLHVAKGIDFRAWIKAMDTKIQEMGVTRLYNCIYSFKRKSDRFNIESIYGNFTSRIIIDCTGSNKTNKNDYKFALVKGQTRTVTKPLELNLPHAISSYGYLIADTKRIIIGSTYEHHYDTAFPTDSHDEQLLKKAFKLPNFRPTSNDIIEKWAGLRVSTPDRIPAIGPSNDNPHLYLYFGLGSKGLFYSGYLSNILAEHLVNRTPIPDKYLTNRLLK